VKAQSSGFAPRPNAVNRPLTCRFVIPCCPLLSPTFGRVAAPARRTQALSGPVELRSVADPLSNLRSIAAVGTWHDPDLGRPIAAPLERCAELLGVDLATIGEPAANVEPYLRADGTRIWSLMRLERQLRLPAYGRRRGSYLDHRRTRQ
jgi:hypothetical protein